ncbi:CAP domain-containing protein [Paraburkholderia acidisoli]|uniref:CAP domain-containing protein n=1 Tax=Paraburkholderia acidisoli TaxID=2571748 RepID=A0A7Z2JH55_9BURK|nr:CAP domain-containing protein [Paraburkholderia acidisoli]QGZ63054.1 CAP domain-containing protein [Paraburkholderia acidisoli]
MFPRIPLFSAPVSALALACAALAACASKPPAPAAAAYTGPVVTLHPVPTGATLVSTGNAGSPAIAWLNTRRAELGLAPIAVDRDLAQAAAAHARYLQLNRAAGHDERPDLPGFTGSDVITRVRLHTPVAGASEVFAVYGGQRAPALPIDEIFAAPYHRGAMLYDWARAGEAALNADASITVLDFADPAPALTASELVAYPYPGQTDAPLAWTDEETPDPMGPDGRYRGAVLGYPITLSGGTNAHVDLLTFELRNAKGKTVRCHIAPVTPAQSGRNTAVCTPYEPLLPGTRYSAHATGLLTQQYGAANVPFDLSWTFSTAAPHPRTLFATRADTLD